MSREPGRDLRDPHHVAIELTEQRGHNALVLQSVSTLRDHVAALQDDMRTAIDTLSTVASQQRDIQGHGTGLERLDAKIVAQGSALTFWRGLVIGVIAMVAALSGAVSYIVQTGFDRGDKEAKRIEAQQIRETDRQDRAIEAFRAELKESKRLEALK